MRCGSATISGRASARAMGHVFLVVASLVGLAALAEAEPVVKAVGPIGMTVADADRSIRFYSDVLGFQKVSDVEVWGGDYERLQGVFGLRMRVVRMRLGN